MNKPVKYECPKCGNRQCEIGEIRTTGSFITKIFNIQNKRFTSVICTKCRYSEFYSMSSSNIGNVLDFIVG